MIRQLAHLCFFSDHVEPMISFYRDCLGLPIKFTMNTDDGELMGYYFDCGNSSFIEVFDQKLAVKQWGGQVQELKAMPSGSQFRHLCFEVLDLESFKQTLEKRGIQVSNISVGKDNSRQAWISDPDGNSIELMEYTPKSLQLGYVAKKE